MSACSLHQNVYCDRKRQRGSRSEPDGAGRGPDGAVRGAAFSSQPAGLFVARTLRLRILRPALPPDARGHHREANPAIAGTLEALTRAARIAPLESSTVTHVVCAFWPRRQLNDRGPALTASSPFAPRQAARGAGCWKRPPWVQKAGRACSVRERGGGGLRGGGLPLGCRGRAPSPPGRAGDAQRRPPSSHYRGSAAARESSPSSLAPLRWPPVSTGQPRG